MQQNKYLIIMKDCLEPFKTTENIKNKYKHTDNLIKQFKSTKITLNVSNLFKASHQ